MTSAVFEPAIDGAPAASETPARRDAGRPGRRRARRGGPQRLWRGRDQDPAWVRPCLLLLLVGTGMLYVWGLGASGWANTYYSAAVQAATRSWKAFFFGSFDSSNAVTVDKAPASLWVMALSARAFGVNSWSILVPQALEGVASVGFLYLAIRRWFSASSALLAGAVLALTPVAALMFRFNNPDAVLVLLLVVGAYGTVRALERGNTWWLLFAFSMVGFGFLAKMLQALLVVPAFGLVYLIAAPVSSWKRVRQLAAACGAMVFVGRLVDRDRGALAGVVTPVHRWVAAQQRPRADLRVQRVRPAHRRRDRKRGRWWSGGSEGADRVDAHVRLGVRHSDLVAASRRADPARRRDRVAGRATTHRPRPRRVRPLGWLAARDRARVQPRQGHHPPVLRDRAGPRDRCDRRHGRGHAVEAPARREGACSARGHRGDDRALDVPPARPHSAVELVAARTAAAGRARRRRRAARRVPGPRPRAGGAGGRLRRGRAHRARGVHPEHRQHAAHGCDPDRGAPGCEHDGLRLAGRRTRGVRGPLPRCRERRPAGGRVHRWSAPRRGWSRGCWGCRWCRWPARRQLAHLGAHRAARGRRRLVPVGRRDGRRQPGRRLPARDRRPGDGRRRLQRHRSHPDARTVPAARARRTIHYFIAGGGFARRGLRGGGFGDSSTSSAIRTWIAANFTSQTVGGVTVYDLTSTSSST